MDSYEQEQMQNAMATLGAAMMGAMMLTFLAVGICCELKYLGWWF